MMYDVAVIGAGPAGSTAARFCALRGLKTLLLDRCSFPRLKICGGGITTAALNALGLALPGPVVLDRVRHLSSFSGSKSVHIPHPRFFMIVTERSVFDNYLVQKAVEAGVDFRPGENLTGLTGTGRDFLIKTPNNSYRAETLIGADGVHSTTARLAGFPRQPRSHALGLTADVRPGAETGLKEAVQIHYNLIPKGYGWIFPKGDRLTLGVGCYTGNYAGLRQALQKLAASAQLELPEQIRGHYVPYGRQTRECLADGIILAGDAAGFVDPFTGEGIRYAVLSGSLAGETVWHCFYHNLPPNKKNLAGYLVKCRQAFLGDFKYSLILAKVFFALPAIMHRFLFDRSDIFSRLLNILEGRYNYQRLVKDVAVELPKYYAKLPAFSLSKIGQIQE